MLPTINFLTLQDLPIQPAPTPAEQGGGDARPAGDFFALLRAAPVIDIDVSAVTGNGLPEIGTSLPTLAAPVPALPGLATGADGAMRAPDPILEGDEHATINELLDAPLEPAIAGISLPLAETGPALPKFGKPAALAAGTPALRPPTVARRPGPEATISLTESSNHGLTAKERPSAVPAMGLEGVTNARDAFVPRAGVQPGPQAPIRTPVSIEPSEPVQAAAADPEQSPQKPEKGLLPGTTGLADLRSMPARDDVQAAARTAVSHAPQNASSLGDSAPLSVTSLRFASDVAPPAPRPIVGPEISLPVQEPGWGKEVAQRVLLMANGRLQNAEIRLSPAELGPLRVQLAIEDGLANVSFQAQHAVTREAIELALPRLRDMLAENGLSLGQASVGDDGVQREARDGAAEPRAGSPVAADDSDLDGRSGSTAMKRYSDGLVDTYA